MLATSVLGCGAKTGAKEGKSLELLDNSGGYAEVGDACSDEADCIAEDACFPLTCSGDVCTERAPVECDDSDPCTEDFCAPETGVCSFVPLTPDRDEDGHRAPLPGFAPGASGSCGDDCDDTSDAAHPGGVETCDGVDNDCNGVVDDNHSFFPSNLGPTLLSEGEEAGLGGISHNGDHYAVSLSYDDGHKQTQLAAVDGAGEIQYAVDVALTNSDTLAGPVIWTGSTFATAWEDRRDDDYEIYFNRFDRDGNKLGPDLRVSTGRGFSLHPTLTLLGSSYLVAWGDERNGEFQVFAARIDRDGVLLDPEGVNLTPDVVGADSPALAVGTQNIGLTFVSQAHDKRILFRSLSHDLSTLGELRVISDDKSTGGGITFSRDNYLITWTVHDVIPGDAVWGTVVDATGSILIAPRKLTESAEFARSHGLLDLGDRLMLFWAQLEESYDIFFRLISPELDPLTEAQRLTTTVGDALGPAPEFGNDGQIGVAYTDMTGGAPKVYFTTLDCR